MATIRLPPDFKEFLSLLNAYQVEYLVVGGYAAGTRTSPIWMAFLDAASTIDPTSEVVEVSSKPADLTWEAVDPSSEPAEVVWEPAEVTWEPVDLTSEPAYVLWEAVEVTSASGAVIPPASSPSLHAFADNVGAPTTSRILFNIRSKSSTIG